MSAVGDVSIGGAIEVSRFPVPDPCLSLYECPSRRFYGQAYFRTPRDAVDAYFGLQIARTARIVKVLCGRSGEPPGWWWGKPNWRKWTPEGFVPEFKLRLPPMPYRDIEFSNPGCCPMCGQPAYDLGWHYRWNDRTPRASWHAACSTLHRFMIKPGDYLEVPIDHEVDHVIPLWRAFEDHRDEPWPDILRFWLPGNLRVMHAVTHKEKTKRENRQRAARRRANRC